MGVGVVFRVVLWHLGLCLSRRIDGAVALCHLGWHCGIQDGIVAFGVALWHSGWHLSHRIDGAVALWHSEWHCGIQGGIVAFGVALWHSEWCCDIQGGVASLLAQRIVFCSWKKVKSSF